MSKAISLPDLITMKNEGRKIVSMTAYDFNQGEICEQAGIDFVLVGDSLGMVIQGQNDTLSVSLDDMIYHTRLVSRSFKRGPVIGDMPFGSYQVSVEQGVAAAVRFIKEGHCQAVKLEGGARRLDLIKAITLAEVPVMGHIGLTPQSVNVFGGFKVQRDAEQIMTDALAVQKAGAFAVVLESVPVSVATAVTQALDIPTIGIGAGAGCDGQILVFHDTLGLQDRVKPKFVKRYRSLKQEAVEGLADYAAEVRSGAFPAAEHSYGETKAKESSQA